MVVYGTPGAGPLHDHSMVLFHFVASLFCKVEQQASHEKLAYQTAEGQANSRLDEIVQHREECQSHAASEARYALGSWFHGSVAGLRRNQDQAVDTRSAFLHRSFG